MPPPSIPQRWLYGCQVAALLLLGCGRIGFDELKGRRTPETQGGGSARADGGASTGNDAAGDNTAGDNTANGDAGTAPDGGDETSATNGGSALEDGGPVATIDGGNTQTGDAGNVSADSGSPPLTCSACGQGETCVNGSCVSECSSTFASATLCAGFETGLTGLDYEAGISEETSLVHAGSKAVRSESSGPGVSAAVTLPLSPTATSGAIYFRAYYYIETAPADGLIKLVAFNSSADHNVDVNISPDRSFDLYFHEMPNGARIQGTPGNAVFGAWMCLQVMVEVSNTVGQVSLSVDGVSELTTSSDRDTRTASGISAADVGIGWSETSGATVVYVDDVVVDSSPVPCQ